MEIPRKINAKNRWKINENSIKNRPKSSLEACWALLGPLGVPYWRSWASWEHLGSVLGASWSVLGASWWHPGARRGPQEGTKIVKKSIQNRIDFLIDFSMRYWWQNGHRMDPQTIQKRFKKVYHFSIVSSSIFGRSWEPKSLKMHLVYTQSSFS